jgi:uncharacterized LabA/DUF88 family protein
MSYRTRVFIDFWNFQLNWNERAQAGHRIDWPRVPQVLLAEATKKFEAAGITDRLALDETLVYASYNPAKDGGLKGWLDSFLNKQPSFRVKTRERRAKPRKVYCAVCKKDHESCPDCGTKFTGAPEKGVDTAIATDLLSLASEQAFDVAILLTSDADFLPAVEWVQAKGLKVVNATWSRHGFDLAKTCWASMELDSLIPLLTREVS